MNDARRVLVVEDDHAVAHALILRLKSEGFEVIPAPDGNTAIQVCRQMPPDVMLLDINLPFKSGFEVAQAVRDVLGEVPIVFMTAQATRDVRDRIAAIDRSWFVEKPFTTPFLIQRVSEAAASV